MAFACFVYKSEWFPLRLLFSTVTVTLHCVVPQLQFKGRLFQWWLPGLLLSSDPGSGPFVMWPLLLPSRGGGCFPEPQIRAGSVLFFNDRMSQNDLERRPPGALQLPLSPLWTQLPREEVLAIVLRGYVEDIWGTQADSSHQYLDFEVTQSKLVPGRLPSWGQTHDRASLRSNGAHLSWVWPPLPAIALWANHPFLG